MRLLSISLLPLILAHNTLPPPLRPDLHTCAPSQHGLFLEHTDVCSSWFDLYPTPGHDPWTHSPFCIRSPAPEAPGETYCLYTNANFHSRRGLSIFTTPATANNVARSPAFLNPASLPEFRSAHPSSQPPFFERDTPGRGVGLFANRTIPRGSPLFQDWPTLIIHKAAFKLFPPSALQEVQWRGLLQLPAATRHRVLAMARHLGPPADPVDDIMKTNAFGQPYSDGDGEGNEVPHIALMPLASRINHACRPNAHYSFSEDTLTHYAYALRDIEVGEEILDSYLDDASLAFMERRDILKRTWGFECQCALCAAGEDVRRESDERVAHIDEVKAKLVDSSERHLVADELLKLYEEEGLVVPTLGLWDVGVYTWQEVGTEESWQRARWYAQKGMDLAGWMLGSGSGVVARLREFLEQTSHVETEERKGLRV